MTNPDDLPRLIRLRKVWLVVRLVLTLVWLYVAYSYFSIWIGALVSLFLLAMLALQWRELRRLQRAYADSLELEFTPDP